MFKFEREGFQQKKGGMKYFLEYINHFFSATEICEQKENLIIEMAYFTYYRKRTSFYEIYQLLLFTTEIWKNGQWNEESIIKWAYFHPQIILTVHV